MRLTRQSAALERDDLRIAVPFHEQRLGPDTSDRPGPKAIETPLYAKKAREERLKPVQTQLSGRLNAPRWLQYAGLFRRGRLAWLTLSSASSSSTPQPLVLGGSAGTLPPLTHSKLQTQEISAMQLRDAREVKCAGIEASSASAMVREKEGRLRGPLVNGASHAAGWPGARSRAGSQPFPARAASAASAIAGFFRRAMVCTSFIPPSRRASKMRSLLTRAR
jgi:hypothetical protein